MRNGNRILADLTVPGRLLLFIDDSGTRGKPLPGLAADFELLCGVAIRGERYEKVRHDLAAELSTVGFPVAEFHATEIVNPDTKKALNKVFFNAVIPYLQTESADTAIVVDSESPLSDALKIQHIATPAGFYEGGVIHVDSRIEAGVQLADLAAYLVNRTFHAKQRLIDDKKGPFDEVVIDSFARLSPLFANVLGLRSKQ